MPTIEQIEKRREALRKRVKKAEMALAKLEAEHDAVIRLLNRAESEKYQRLADAGAKRLRQGLGECD